MIYIDRMIGRLSQLVKNANISFGLSSSAEYSKTEIFLAYHLGTGECKQNATRLDLFKGDGVQFSLTLKGISKNILMFGKGRRIQYDQIIVMSHAFQIFKSIFRKGLMSAISREVQFNILICQ